MPNANSGIISPDQASALVDEHIKREQKGYESVHSILPVAEKKNTGKAVSSLYRS